MPAGSTRLSNRHGMKSWRTDDESSRGTDLTATRTELNNMSASGAAPFRKQGRKYSAISHHAKVMVSHAEQSVLVTAGMRDPSYAWAEFDSDPRNADQATMTGADAALIDRVGDPRHGTMA